MLNGQNFGWANELSREKLSLNEEKRRIKQEIADGIKILKK